MANVTILNGQSSTVGGAALFTATTNTRILIDFAKASSGTLTVRWGNSVNYNQVSSSDMGGIGRYLARVYMSNNDTYSIFTGATFGSYRFSRAFHGANSYAGLSTTMAYPLEIYLQSGEIFDMTCANYSVMAITE
jgi:hypothetical protein